MKHSTVNEPSDCSYVNQEHCSGRRSGVQQNETLFGLTHKERTHFLLEEEDTETNLMITGFVGERIVTVTQDTGSQYNAIEEDLYLNSRKQKLIIKENYCNINTSSIIPKQSVQVRKRVMLEIIVCEQAIVAEFLVVRGLKTDVVIGADTMRKLEMKINYYEKYIEWNVGGIKMKWNLFEKKEKTDAEMQHYVDSLYLNKEEETNYYDVNHSTVEKEEIRQRIRQKVVNIENIPEERLLELEQLRRIRSSAVQNLKKSTEARNRTHNNRYAERKFEQGDLVLLRNKKLGKPHDNGCKKFY